MSAVYRIEVQSMPQDILEWYASAWRISDDSYMSGSGNYGESPEEAVQKVQEWIAAEALRQEGFTVYTDEDGNVVESHSVKS